MILISIITLEFITEHIEGNETGTVCSVIADFLSSHGIHFRPEIIGQIGAEIDDYRKEPPCTMTAVKVCLDVTKPSTLTLTIQDFKQECIMRRKLFNLTRF